MVMKMNNICEKFVCIYKKKCPVYDSYDNTCEFLDKGCLSHSCFGCESSWKNGGGCVFPKLVKKGS